ncbi:MAG: ABC transporter substrate-binding protein [Lewinellaceae bacterium]|nr:ABC transporter substrate-binding protein [Lewinellaceae bacterium]
MKNTRLTFLFFLCLGLWFTACKDDRNNSQFVQLGAIYNLGGTQSDLDIPSSKGAMLAVKQLNAAGGVLGRTVELLLEDGNTDTMTIRQKVEKILKEAPAVAAFLGLSDTDMALAAAPAAKSANRVFLTSGATSPQLPGQVPDYLYLACFGDNVQAAAAAEWAYNVLNARSAAVLFDSLDTYTVLLHQYFADRFQSLGGSVAAVQGYDPDNTGQFGQGLPTTDIVFLSAAIVERIAPLVRQLRQQGITSPVIGGDGYDSETGWAANADIADVYYTTHAYLGADNTNAAIQNFRTAYSAEYSGSQPDAFAALGYDAVMLLADAIERAGSANPNSVRNALAVTNNFQGLTGTITYEAGKQIPRKSVSIIEVKNGKVSLKEDILPTMVPDP